MRWGWLAWLLLAGCSNSTALFVDLRTDLLPNLEFASVRTELAREDGRAVDAATLTTLAGMTDFVGGERVAEFTGLASGSYSVEVTLLDARGAFVAARTVRVMVSGTTGITALITRDCRNVTCPRVGDAPDQTTCVGGSCVTPCGTGSCGPSECVNGGDCPTMHDCTEPSCPEGVCFYAPRDSRCAVGETCRADLGCIPAVDGGMMDAGGDTPIDGDGDGFASTDSGGDDCDDSDPEVHPGATELCDGVDQNCVEGTSDEVGIQAGVCQSCGPSGATPAADGTDPFNDCEAGSCGASGYYFGWEDDSCYQHGGSWGQDCDGTSACRSAETDCLASSVRGSTTGPTRGVCQVPIGCTGLTPPSLANAAAGSDPAVDCGDNRTCDGTATCCSSQALWQGSTWTLRYNESCLGNGTYPGLGFTMVCAAVSGDAFTGTVSCDYTITGTNPGTCDVLITRLGCDRFSIVWDVCTAAPAGYVGNGTVTMTGDSAGSGNFTSTIGECGTMSVER